MITVAPRPLVVEDLRVRYGGVLAVDGVSFTVEPGRCLGIIGANGAGKTSTLKAVMGLVSRSCTGMKLGDVDLARVRARDVVRHGIGYVPEGRHVFGGLTVATNLELGAYSRRSGLRERQEEVYELFPVLAEMRRRLAGALSGGQQQMLAIGRALMSGPDLLILDEPSMGLSPKLVGQVLESLLALRERGLSVLLVEQNAWLTFEASDTCLVMENGTVALAGSAGELRHDERVRRIYLGL
ncbi:ABC transporter ATP-binding protein [Kineosporia succinea]|uniref:Branched-chain amino acid transport system ATP-binding protein n=1 Tax=Kineosporia succinea TaxID=84632 RepID=A0ABT9PAK3_9ACTN|nr:ABC transporter ATP-binding protein [Kineosporia succinea]MDP9829722.1 branched-chain amino acid transport system ATP-binding protein [Kineosporia succinea]